MGARRLLAAIRAQNIPVVALGAAIAAIGLIRRLEGPQERLVYSQRLKPGESVRVGLAAADQARRQPR